MQPQQNSPNWVEALSNTYPPKKSFSRLLAAALIASIALVVGGVLGGIVGAHSVSTRMAPVKQSAVAPSPGSSVPQPADVHTVTKDLCTEAAPLFAEEDRESNIFADSGKPGSPERDAAIPKYRSHVEKWATHMQTILDAHPTADPFLRRTLQRYIDDLVLYVRNVRPNKQEPYDKQIWEDSLSTYGGPISVCYKVGVKW